MTFLLCHGKTMINTHTMTMVIEIYISNTCIGQWHSQIIDFLWNAMWKSSAKLSFPVFFFNYLRCLRQLWTSFVTTISIASVWSILPSLWSNVSSSEGSVSNFFSFFFCETFSSNETKKHNFTINWNWRLKSKVYFFCFFDHYDYVVPYLLKTQLQKD